MTVVRSKSRRGDLGRRRGPGRGDGDGIIAPLAFIAIFVAAVAIIVLVRGSAGRSGARSSSAERYLALSLERRQRLIEAEANSRAAGGAGGGVGDAKGSLFVKGGENNGFRKAKNRHPIRSSSSFTPPPPKVVNAATNTIEEPPYGTFRLRLVVLTQDRPRPLRRMLKSLVEARYFNETADLDIWVDHRPSPEPTTMAGTKKRKKVQPSSAEPKAQATTHPQHDPDVVRAAESLIWPHGTKSVHLRTQNVGLVRQWHETWNLSLTSSGIGEGLTPQTREKVLILEDDLEVSPHFWRWLRWCHHAYGDRPDFAACTLQRVDLCAAECGRHLGGGPEGITPNFMYPLVGSWGYSPSASHWVNFTSWYRTFVQSGQKPYVVGLTPNSWYRGKEKNCPGPRCRMWTMHHLKYCDIHQDRYTVYAKAGGEAGKATTLGANWKESGLNYGGKKGRGSLRSDFPRVKRWDDVTLGRFDADPTRLNWSAKPTGKGKGLETSWNETWLTRKTTVAGMRR